MNEDINNNELNQQVEYTDDNIRHLSDMEHVRTRPGMYIGRLGDGSLAEDGIYVVRTFITYEMATGRQQEEFNDRRSRILTTQETEQLIRLRRWEMEQEIKRITPDFLPSS